MNCTRIDWFLFFIRYFYKVAKQFHILLADDDQDDRFFFARAFEKVPIPTKLTTVENGEKLMHYLSGNSILPDALFLDLNMPRKNGLECLSEIKNNEILKHLPVIIYSTSLNEIVADLLYKNGAHYYMRKASLEELEESLRNILTLMAEKKFTRPSRSHFILSLLK